MQLSAVIVTYRTGPILFDCLGALLADEDIEEVVVVDNGNPTELELRLDALRLREAKLRVLRGHGNVGFARACNHGARTAHGETLLFVNPDVIVERGAARGMRAALDGLPSPAIVGGDLRTAEGGPDRGSRRDRVTLWRAVVSYSGVSRFAGSIALCRDLHRHHEPLPADAIAVGAVSGALLMMRRADFMALGGFDEDYFLHFEDVDLCRRVEEAKGAVMFQPGAIGTHMRSTSDAPAAWITRHKLRGLAHYVRKFAHSPLERFIAGLMQGALKTFLPV
ncbi:MAG TPA: glycosyltransferase family 2 protein [Caulobacterales bacterium]|nr:glycosyltransferase family 2 protein [Caulobacterales bacterium]